MDYFEETELLWDDEEIIDQTCHGLESFDFQDDPVVVTNPKVACTDGDGEKTKESNVLTQNALNGDERDEDVELDYAQDDVLDIVQEEFIQEHDVLDIVQEHDVLDIVQEHDVLDIVQEHDVLDHVQADSVQEDFELTRGYFQSSSSRRKTFKKKPSTQLKKSVKRKCFRGNSQRHEQYLPRPSYLPASPPLHLSSTHNAPRPQGPLPSPSTQGYGKRPLHHRQGPSSSSSAHSHSSSTPMQVATSATHKAPRPHGFPPSSSAHGRGKRPSGATGPYYHNPQQHPPPPPPQYHQQAPHYAHHPQYMPYSQGPPPSFYVYPPGYPPQSSFGPVGGAHFNQQQLGPLGPPPPPSYPVYNPYHYPYHGQPQQHQQPHPYHQAGPPPVGYLFHTVYYHHQQGPPPFAAFPGPYGPPQPFAVDPYPYGPPPPQAWPYQLSSPSSAYDGPRPSYQW